MNKSSLKDSKDLKDSTLNKKENLEEVEVDLEK